MWKIWKYNYFMCWEWTTANWSSLVEIVPGETRRISSFPHSFPHISSGKITLQHRKRDDLLSTINRLLKAHPGPSIVLARHLGSRWGRPMSCPQSHFLSTVTSGPQSHFLSTTPLLVHSYFLSTISLPVHNPTSCPQTYFLSTKSLPVHKLTTCPPASWLERKIEKDEDSSCHGNP